jgi:ubiquinone/menaquinone biosynthesis C-methylase UbiE
MNNITHFSNDLVRRINEIFHDIDAESYGKVHNEIFVEEVHRWQNVFSKFLPQSPKKIIDFGCGTGFLESLLSDYVHANDTLVCMDISHKMIEVVQSNTQNFPCAVVYSKIDGSFAEPDTSVDVILLNSVLHHIPNYKEVLDSMVRSLKPNGLFFIGHEPNARFVQSSFLRKQYLLLKQLRLSVLLVWLRKIFVKKSLSATDTVSSINAKINEILLQEQRIDTPLQPAEISALIDIHSYTAGGMHLDRGFDCVTIADQFRGKCSVVHLETYNHLSKLSHTNILYRAYSTILQWIFPTRGSLFFFILQKNA